MFRVLSNQHYQHRTNQKLCSWANAVFQNHGVCGQASLSLPSPFPIIPFFLLSSQRSQQIRAKRLLRRLDQYLWPLRPKEEGCSPALQKLRLLHCLGNHVETAINCSREQCFVLNALTCLFPPTHSKKDFASKKNCIFFCRECKFKQAP